MLKSWLERKLETFCKDGKSMLPPDFFTSTFMKGELELSNIQVVRRTR